MRIIVFGAVFWLSVAACEAATELDRPSSASQPATVEGHDKLSQQTIVANKFKDALLTRDYDVLRDFSGVGDTVFFDGDKLDKDIYDFLYTERSSIDGGSIIKISKSPLITRIIPQKNGVFTAIYIQRKYQEQWKDQYFLESQWMKSYFACEFIWNGERYLLYQNFCFAETGGPFH